MTLETASSACPGAMWISRPEGAGLGSVAKASGTTLVRRPDTVRASGKDKRRDRLEYRLIFAAAFFVFFVTAAFERVLPTHWAGRAGDGERKSVFAQAWASADISAAYAFMG